MNAFQTCYAIALLALAYPAWGRQRYALAWLSGNLLATLAACLAMDVGALGRTDATLTMMVIDFACGVGLAMRPGLPRLIAWGYAVTVPIYWLNVMHGVQIGTTYSILYVAAVAQLGVLASGSFGDVGGGMRRRAIRRLPVAISGGKPGAIWRGGFSPWQKCTGAVMTDDERKRIEHAATEKADLANRLRKAELDISELQAAKTWGTRVVWGGVVYLASQLWTFISQGGSLK